MDELLHGKNVPSTGTVCATDLFAQLPVAAAGNHERSLRIDGSTSHTSHRWLMLCTSRHRYKNGRA